MNSLSGSWKKMLIVFAAALPLLFVSRQSGDGRGAAAAERPAPAASQVAPEEGPPPSNEISEFQQLD